MPATQLNKEVMEGKVKNLSIIKLLSYQTSTVGDQMYVSYFFSLWVLFLFRTFP